ncbi:CBS domain-containing protein [Kribbella speibonae]|uniref:CBS domain-containing protein n=1 Tax=Kribbella speibonae TaxID=1572660 RepID=A0ABY2AG78_9ACTN|nr:CBS domain-containing protein [Kribbella speibonae]TCC27326.1 CBS domain-containing protein [Kribbella speibonae]
MQNESSADASEATAMQAPPASPKTVDEDAISVFHRINSVIPESQSVLMIAPDVRAGAALQILDEQGYSQLPVVRSGEVLGVFSYRSFGLGVLRDRSRISPSEMPVEEFLEEAQIAHATAELSSVYEALTRDDVVLVGTPDDLQAVVTPIDLVRYLSSLSEPFVQLGEVERSLRAIVRHSLSLEDIRACARHALASAYPNREDDIPDDVDEMTLTELVSLIRDGRNYENFAALLGPHRGIFQAKVSELAEIRNVALHFKRELKEDERKKLSEIRLWLLRKLRGNKVMP